MEPIPVSRTELTLGELTAETSFASEVKEPLLGIQSMTLSDFPTRMNLNPISMLQMAIEAKTQIRPRYKSTAVAKSKTPLFEVSMVLKDQELGSAQGKNKREAKY